MPSRTIILVIIVFWLLTAGWFVVRDVQLFHEAGEPVPYAIELADEVRGPNVPSRWTCTLNGKKIGTLRTGIAYRTEDDTFELAATCPHLVLATIGPIRVLATSFDDRVRVTREGGLRAMNTSVKLIVEGIEPAFTARLYLTAVVRGGRMERYVELQAPTLGKFSPQLEATDPPRGSVLNPMHPVPRITGLTPGKTWRQPLADPRNEILRAALAQLPGNIPLVPESPAALTARVLPEPQTLEWPGETHMCLVVEYSDGEDYIARTWVNMSDGAVLRQEAGAHGEMLVLQRE